MKELNLDVNNFSDRTLVDGKKATSETLLKKDSEVIILPPPFRCGGHGGTKKLLKLKNQSIYVDVGIAKYIEEINKLGFITSYCCSGMKKDHIKVGEKNLT